MPLSHGNVSSADARRAAASVSYLESTRREEIYVEPERQGYQEQVEPTCRVKVYVEPVKNKLNRDTGVKHIGGRNRVNLHNAIHRIATRTVS